MGPNHKRPNDLLLPEMQLENIPVDQAVAFLLGYCSHAGTPFRTWKIEADDIVSLGMQDRTVVECLDSLAQQSGCVWSINSNGSSFHFLKE